MRAMRVTRRTALRLISLTRCIIIIWCIMWCHVELGAASVVEKKEPGSSLAACTLISRGRHVAGVLEQVGLVHEGPEPVLRVK